MQTQSRADALTAQYIEEHPRKPGDTDEVWLTGSHVAVWAIIGKWLAYRGDVRRVAHAYRVLAETVDAAVAYYECDQALIDARCAANYADGETR